MAAGAPTRIEPCHIEALPRDLSDAIVELVQAATQLGARLHHRTAASLAELVAIVNCHYSNLIEGHDGRPRDIERALADDLDEDGRRDLQLEAPAHVRVQREVEAAFAGGALGQPTSIGFLRTIHRSFYQGAPPSGTIGAVTAQADGSGAPAERSVEGASPEDPESRPARSIPARR